MLNQILDLVLLKELKEILCKYEAGVSELTAGYVLIISLASYYVENIF